MNGEVFEVTQTMTIKKKKKLKDFSDFENDFTGNNTFFLRPQLYSTIIHVALLKEFFLLQPNKHAGAIEITYMYIFCTPVKNLVTV